MCLWSPILEDIMATNPSVEQNGQNFFAETENFEPPFNPLRSRTTFQCVFKSFRAWQNLQNVISSLTPHVPSPNHGRYNNSGYGLSGAYRQSSWRWKIWETRTRFHQKAVERKWDEGKLLFSHLQTGGAAVALRQRLTEPPLQKRTVARRYMEGLTLGMKSKRLAVRNNNNAPLQGQAKLRYMSFC